MSQRICYDCLEPNEKLWKDKGTLICPKCYHKRYGKKKFVNQNKEEKKYTMEDVKRHLEKHKWG